jgi:regulatory protein
MILTKMEEAGKKQVRIFFDEERYCLLYLSELRKMGFYVEQEISGEDFQELNEMLLRRAKMKAMTLLKHRDRTKKELEERLLRLEFPDFIVEEAIRYVESYGYINDEEYVRRYMEYKAGNKSRLQIKQELRMKGIDGEFLEKIWDDYEYEEEAVLDEQIQKRIRQKGPVTELNFRKNYAYFARKGFSSNNILKLLKKYKQ